MTRGSRLTAHTWPSVTRPRTGLPHNARPLAANSQHTHSNTTCRTITH